MISNESQNRREKEKNMHNSENQIKSRLNGKHWHRNQDRKAQQKT